MKRTVYIVVFFLIFFIGLALRSPEILGGNYLFGFDQGQNYIKAYEIAIQHKFTLIGAEVGSGSAGVPGLFHGPGFYYLLAVMLLLFHGDPYGGLVLMWISGVIALLLIFLTVRRMFDQKTGLAAMFLVSIAPLIAPQSRFVWGPHVASVFLVLYYYTLYKIPDKPHVYVFWSVFLAGLLYHFELALSVPLIILSGVAILVYRVFNTKVLVMAFLAMVLAYAPMILFEVRHGFMATNGIIKNISTQRELSPDDAKVVQKYGDFQLAQKTQQFVSNFRDSFVFENSLVLPQWYLWAVAAVAAVSVLSVVKSKEKRVKQYFTLLFLAIPISMLVFLPLRGSIWPYYLIHLHFVYLYAFAYGSVFVLRHIRTSWIYVVASIFVIFFFFSLTKGAVTRIKSNWNVDYADYGGKDKIKGKRAVIDYVYEDAAGKPFSVFVFMPAVYTWPYDYLFLTYGKEKYGYMPSHEKKGTVYLIIEKDPEKPWSYNGWLETVIKDGTVVWERYLKESDHIVQKREFN